MASFFKKLKAAATIGNNDSWSNPEPRKQAPASTPSPAQVQAIRTAKFGKYANNPNAVAEFTKSNAPVQFNAVRAIPSTLKSTATSVGEMAKSLDPLAPVVKPLVNGNIDLAKTGAGLLTGNKQATRNAFNAFKNDYKPAQEVAQNFVTRPVAQIATTAIQPNKQNNVSYHPNKGVEKFVFGERPVQSIQAGVRSNYREHPNLPAPARIGLATGYGVLQVANDAPLIGGATKSVVKGVSKAVKGPGLTNEAMNKRGALMEAYTRSKQANKPESASIYARQIQEIDNTAKSPLQRAITPLKGNQGGYISMGKDGKPFVKVTKDQHLFDNAPPEQHQAIAQKYLNDNFKGKTIQVDGDGNIAIGNRGIGKFTSDSQRLSKETLSDKMRLSTELDNALKVSTKRSTVADRGGRHGSFAKDGFDYRSFKFEVGGKQFVGTVNVAKNGKASNFYDIHPIKELPNKSGSRLSGSPTNGDTVSPNGAPTGTIPNNVPHVNRIRGLDKLNNNQAGFIKLGKPRLTPLKNNQAGFVKVGKGETPGLNESDLQNLANGMDGLSKFDEATQANMLAAYRKIVESKGANFDEALKASRKYGQFDENGNMRPSTQAPEAPRPKVTMNEGRANLVLDKKIRYKGQVMTKRDYLDALSSDGYVPQMQKVNGKTKYVMKSASGDYFDVSKIEHDLAKSKQPLGETIQLQGQTKVAPKTATGIQQTAFDPQNYVQPTQKTGKLTTPQQLAKQVQETATPEVKNNRSLSTNNSTTVKVVQRGGTKQVTVGRVTIPDDLVGDPRAWKDVGSTFKSQDRIIEAAAPTEAQYKKIWEWAIRPRGEAVTAMVDETKVVKDELRNVIKTYNLKGKETRADVMRFGEKKISYDDLVTKHGQKQADNIVEADKWFRSQYDRLLDETNAVLRKFKQPEIPRRDNYYTHFQDDNIWATAGLKMRQLAQSGDVMQEVAPQGMRTQKIDPKLLGQSEFTKPNKKYNPFAQHRTGDKTKYDAVEAFERYLIPTLHNKHLTESVVKTRMLTKQFQEATAESKNLPNFIRSLQEYGNNLSGKTNRFDRPFLETKWGKRAMDSTRYAQQQMGRNTILGSVRSAVMQTASLPLSIKEAGMANTTLGLMDEIVGKATGNDAAKLSPFLRRRYADLDSVIPSKLRKAENAAAFAFEQIEQTSAKGIWRANHRKALSSGLSGKQAVDEADRITERILGGRAIGERAEAFRSVIGNTGLQFQLEVNNFMQEVMRDTGQKDVKKLLKLFAATYAFNELMYEPLLGDKPLPDPVDATMETFKLAQEGNTAAAVGRMPAEVLSNVPGGSVLAGLYPKYGMEVAGKRLPTREKLFGDTEAGRYGGSLAALGVVKNPEYLIPKSFGLKQVDRTVGGIQDLLKGEKQDKDGKSLFPVAKDPINAAKATLLGTYGTNEGKAYLKQNADNKLGRDTVKTTTNGTTQTSDTKPWEDPKTMQTMFGKDFTSLTNDDKRKEWASKSPDNKAIYDKYQAMKTQMNAKPADDIPESLKNTTAGAFTKKLNGFTKEGKDSWYKQTPSEKDKALYDAANAVKGKDWLDLPKSNQTIADYIAYQKKVSKATTNFEKQDAAKEFVRDTYKQYLPENARKLFSGTNYNEDQKLAAIASGELTQADFEKALQLDNMMYEKGLSSSLAISKKIRSKYGYGAPSKSGGGSGGRSGGGRKKSNIKLSDYSVSDIYKTTSSHRKKLRDLLEQAKV